MREFVAAISERDAQKLCEELVTREFRERLTGATGDAADDACRKQFRALRGPAVGSLRIESTKIEGERGTVRALVDYQGVQQPRTFELRKEEGDWRVATG